MENTTLRKKLSTYLTDGGRLKNVSEDVLFELITAWETWTGTATDFYKSVGFTHRQMAGLVGKAKKLKRSGYFGNPDFKEIKVAGFSDKTSYQGSPCTGIEMVLGDGKIIKFPGVEPLLEFMKKVS